MPPLDPALLTETSPLRPGDAVGVIALLDDGRYLLQLRDNKSGIFFPGYWSLFGGGIDPGEADEAALWRELQEELGITPAPGTARFFTRFDFNMDFCGLPPIYRSFFTVTLPAADLSRLVVTEGQGLRAFSAVDVLLEPHIAPYDAFALWLHINQRRLTA